MSEGCTACEKGLLYVAKKVTSGKDAEIKKLKLCSKHRKVLIESVNEVFAEQGEIRCQQ